MSERPVVICFAGDVWDANPHSRHYLMRRFARAGYEVLFVEGAFVRSIAKLDRGAWWRIFGKLRRGIALHTPEPGLHVLRPIPLPPSGGLRRIALPLLRLQIELALRWLRLRGERVAWFSWPLVAPMVGHLGERASVFFYQDRYHEFTDVDVDQLLADTRHLATHCDLSIASATALGDDLRAMGADPVVVSHGVDVERFEGTPSPPPDLQQLERPLVGFVGLVDDHMWLDSFAAIADRLDTGTVVIVGGTNTSLAQLEHPRIALLGYRPFATMPAYIGAFDCCLVPFRLNGLTEAVNPIKLREYLAAGRPVVSSAMPEVEAYGDVVALARTPAEFTDAVMRTLDDPGADTDEARDRRRSRVAGESWDVAAARVRELVDPLMGR